MEESYESERTNGGTVDDETSSKTTTRSHREETLYGVIRLMITMILFPDQDRRLASASLLQRIKISLGENVPRLHDAFRNTARDVLIWTRKGSPLRALLVISVGTITLLTLTGLFVFMLFFLAATINAVVISLLMSLAAAGGFLALFFTFVTAIYIGALSIAAFVISTATISAIAAVMIVSGWIGFFCPIWMATKKSVNLAKHSLDMAGSAISSARHGRHHNGPDKVSSD